MGRSPEPYLRRRFRPWEVGHWEIWQLRAPVVVAVLLVCGSAAVLVGIQFLILRPTARDALLTGALVLLGLVHTEVASKVERMRRRVSDTSYYDLSSVWTFAAALLLPAAVATGVVVVLYAHLWLRVWKPARVPLYRLVYTTATVVLAARQADRLADQVSALKAAGAMAVDTREFDADNLASHGPLVASIVADHGPIGTAVLAFGILGDQARAETDAAHAVAVVHTDYLAQVSLLTHLATAMRKASLTAWVESGSRATI